MWSQHVKSTVYCSWICLKRLFMLKFYLRHNDTTDWGISHFGPRGNVFIPKYLFPFFWCNFLFTMTLGQVKCIWNVTIHRNNWNSKYKYENYKCSFSWEFFKLKTRTKGIHSQSVFPVFFLWSLFQLSKCMLTCSILFSSYSREIRFMIKTELFHYTSMSNMYQRCISLQHRFHWFKGISLPSPTPKKPKPCRNRADVSSNKTGLSLQNLCNVHLGVCRNGGELARRTPDAVMLLNVTAF